jgi:hypothetical protein
VLLVIVELGLTRKGETVKWRIKRQKSAHTYHVSAMWQVEKNTAEKRAARQAATMWKSHVNAIIRRVRSQFGCSRLEVLPTWPADDDR